MNLLMFLLMLLVCFFQAGCGQQGALYLPNPKLDPKMNQHDQHDQHDQHEKNQVHKNANTRK